MHEGNNWTSYKAKAAGSTTMDPRLQAQENIFSRALETKAVFIKKKKKKQMEGMIYKKDEYIKCNLRLGTIP